MCETSFFVRLMYSWFFMIVLSPSQFTFTLQQSLQMTEVAPLRTDADKEYDDGSDAHHDETYCLNCFHTINSIN